jgi:hypothetical protein
MRILSFWHVASAFSGLEEQTKDTSNSPLSALVCPLKEPSDPSSTPVLMPRQHNIHAIVRSRVKEGRVSYMYRCPFVEPYLRMRSHNQRHMCLVALGRSCHAPFTMDICMKWSLRTSSSILGSAAGSPLGGSGGRAEGAGGGGIAPDADIIL